MAFLRLIALLEGLSLLILLLVAMPLKYHFAMPEAVSWVGRLHGGLFLTFNLLLFYKVVQGRLSEVQGFLGLLASLVPLGTFWFKAKWLNGK